MKQYRISLERIDEVFTSGFSDLFAGTSLENDWDHGYGVRIKKDGRNIPRAAPFFIMTDIRGGRSFVYELDGEELVCGALEEADRDNPVYAPYVAVEAAEKDLSPSPKLPEELRETLKKMAADIVNDIHRINVSVGEERGVPMVSTKAKNPSRTDIFSALAFYAEVTEENPVNKMKRIAAEINGKIDRMVQTVLDAGKRSAPSAGPGGSAPAAKGRGPAVDDAGYLRLLDKRAKEQNARLDAFWRKITFSRENELEEQVAKGMIRGRSQVLMGDSGIGKTYTPSMIAKQNGIPVRKIELEANTEGAELIGKPYLRPNLFTGTQEMFFDEGFLVKSFKEAAALAKEGRGMVLILDELFRMNDMTPLISNLSVNDRGEYALTYDKTVYFAKIRTDRGDLWFELSDDLDAERQRYEIRDGEVHIEGDPGILAYGGSRGMAQERAFRGDLLSMHKQDFQELFQNGKKTVLETMDAKAKIYVPERAVALIATSNIGEDYEVNMARDNALLSRMGPVPVKAPSVDFMVRQSLSEALGYKNWTKEETKRVEKVLRAFFTTIDKKIRQDRRAEFGQKVNFRMIRNAIDGISPDKPMDDPDHSVYEVLRDLAIEFVPLDSALDAETLLDSRIVHDVRNAVKVLEDENVGGKTRQRKAPPRPRAEEEGQEMGTGMKP